MSENKLGTQVGATVERPETMLEGLRSGFGNCSNELGALIVRLSDLNDKLYGVRDDEGKNSEAYPSRSGLNGNMSDLLSDMERKIDNINSEISKLADFI